MADSKKQIALLCCSKSWGGLEINVFRLAEWLAETFSVTLLCTEDSPLANAAKQSSFTVMCIKKPAKHFPVYAASKIQRKLKQQRIGHLMIIDNKDMPLGFWIKFLSGCHIKFLYQQQMQLGISKRDIVHTIRYKMLDAWISPLHWLREEVIQKTKVKKEKIHIIPLGVDVEKIQHSIKNKQEARDYFGIKSNRLVFGILGRIDRQKNQHLLLEAALKLEQQQLPIDILIVGEPTKNTTDTYFDEIKDFVSRHKMEEHVFIRPFMNEISYFFGVIDYFVMATDRETYGMVTLESMLYGVPVIASNSGGSVEILKEGSIGTLYESGNSNDLAEKIKYVLTQEEEIKEKAQKALQIAQGSYNHKLECELINKLINNL